MRRKLDAPLPWLARFGAFLSILVVLLPVVAAAAPTLVGPAARPSYITPNADGVTDATEITFTPGSDDAQVNARVEIHDVLPDTLLAVIFDAMVAPAGETAVQWAPAAGSVADGDYRVDVVIDDLSGSITQSVIVRVDTVFPVLTLGAVGPDPFDPTAAPPANALSIPLNVIGPDAVTVVEIRQSGAVVKTLGTFVGAGADTMSWDGNNSTGGIATSGAYQVRAIASDVAGNADTSTVTVTLDRVAPVFGVASPPTVQTDSFPVTLAGTVTDTDRVVSVTYSLGDSTFLPVDVANTPAAAVTWSVDVTIPSPEPGFYDVTVRAQDRVGHVKDVTYEIAYDTTLPQPLSTSVVGSAVVADGGTLQLRTNWNLSGLDVSVSFTPIDFGYSSGDETVVEDSPGSYLVTHRITPSNIRASGLYTLKVIASTGVVSGTDSVQVTLDATSLSEGELVAISANRFDPEAGESVSLAASRNGDVVRVEVFNLAGQPIRVLTGTGYVDWDGRGENGQTAASGVYFLRVVVNEAEEVRKVAVLRGGGS